MSDEWFRRPGWDDAARKEFEQRLARARPHNRPQYLRIKALALRDAGDIDPAKSLLLRVLDLPGVPAHEAASAEELLGDLAARQGDGELAERHYRRILTEHPSLNGTTGTVELSLAELLLARGKFDNQLFRWHLAFIELSAHRPVTTTPSGGRQAPPWSLPPAALSCRGTRTSAWFTPTPRPCAASASSPDSGPPRATHPPIWRGHSSSDSPGWGMRRPTRHG